MKMVNNTRLGETGRHTISRKSSAAQNQHLESKKRKRKKKRNRAAPNEQESTLLLKPTSRTPSNTWSLRSLERDIEIEINDQSMVLRDCAAKSSLKKPINDQMTVRTTKEDLLHRGAREG